MCRYTYSLNKKIILTFSCNYSVSHFVVQLKESSDKNTKTDDSKVMKFCLDFGNKIKTMYLVSCKVIRSVTNERISRCFSKTIERIYLSVQRYSSSSFFSSSNRSQYFRKFIESAFFVFSYF